MKNKGLRLRFHPSAFILHPSSGQAYIELVMVLPMFLIVIAALIMFGRVLYVKIAMRNKGSTITSSMYACPRSEG